MTHNIPENIKQINEENSKTMLKNNFFNLKELRESMEYLITLNTKYQRRYPMELFLYLNKISQKGKVYLKNLIMTF